MPAPPRMSVRNSLAAIIAGRHLVLTASALLAMNVFLAAATQFMAESESRSALLIQAFMLGLTALVFSLAVVSRTMIGPSKIQIDPRRASNWWRSNILGKGVQIRRQDFSLPGGQADGPAEMPRLERRDKPAPLGVLLAKLIRPKGLHPSAENVYDLFLESLDDAWDGVWRTAHAISVHVILAASALLIMDAGLAWANRLAEESSPFVAHGLRMMELCVTMIILANGLGLTALGAACVFMRRSQQGVVLVLAGYALTVGPILLYTGQCGVLLPVLTGGAGIAAAAITLASAD